MLPPSSFNLRYDPLLDLKVDCLHHLRHLKQTYIKSHHLSLMRSIEWKCTPVHGWWVKSFQRMINTDPHLVLLSGLISLDAPPRHTPLLQTEQMRGRPKLFQSRTASFAFLVMWVGGIGMWRALSREFYCLPIHQNMVPLTLSGLNLSSVKISCSKYYLNVC